MSGDGDFNVNGNLHVGNIQINQWNLFGHASNMELKAISKMYA